MDFFCGSACVTSFASTAAEDAESCRTGGGRRRLSGVLGGGPASDATLVPNFRTDSPPDSDASSGTTDAASAVAEAGALAMTRGLLNGSFRETLRATLVDASSSLASPMPDIACCTILSAFSASF